MNDSGVVIKSRRVCKHTRMSLKDRLLNSWKVKTLYGALARGRSFQAQRAAVKAKTYLNVGCGPNWKPNFINLDYQWMQGIDLCWDLRKSLPLADDSLSGVYSEHCLEHLTYDDCFNVLREFKRVLKPGGIARVVVPDAELYFDLYQRHKAGEEVAFPYVPTPPPEDFTPIMAINNVFRDHGHQYSYDEVTLRRLMEKAGFADVRRESFMQGRDAVLLIDREDRAVESLYMEARA